MEAIETLTQGGAGHPGEEELVRLAKTGDAQAWSTLFDEYYLALYRYAYARLLSREEAEDAASQAFLNAYAAIGKFQLRGRPILAWLYTITRNIVNAKRRSSGRFPTQAMPEHLLASSETADALVGRLDLVESIAKLKEEQREVVLLRFAMGMSLKETAVLMGKSEGAIHSLQVRALDALRRKLTK